ncbi:hypothetical protein CWI84_08965 [Idiomarina tyrosinivorans]|uniref:Capsule assembly Wzi family protein n=1 Tax=Idiomarina tyrosinivorans TaxID=1445662 RepID=A0A432ZPD6_9GAMM|nr:capsule assembly Wzi family protein [Idiomarina tyrosinivorans]RUO79754.1 hypothetical protein CWI84_08965 [Idiomarina tyrosinivorans]
MPSHRASVLKKRLKKSFTTTAMMVALVAYYFPAADASVWVESDDQRLRQSLQVLVNGGWVDTPVQQFPFPWRALLNELHAINVSALNVHERYAYDFIRHRLQYAEHGPRTRLVAKAATDNALFVNNAFADARYEQASLAVRQSFVGDHWAAGLQITRRYHPFEGHHDTVLDGSYIAFNLADWSFSLDTLPMWWGPSQHSALLFSENARPFTKLRATYAPAAAVDWLGPMQASVFVGEQSNTARIDSRTIAGARLAFTPLTQLNLGLNWVQQSATSERGSQQQVSSNQLASIDFRAALPLGTQSLAVYGEFAIETSTSKFDDSAKNTGIQWSFGGRQQSHQVTLEFSDTRTATGASFYQTYQGYQQFSQYGRSMGSSYPNNSKTWSLTYQAQQANGQQWGATLLKSQQQASQDDIEWRLAGVSYTHPVLSGLATLTVEWQQREQLGASKNEVVAGLRWEWRY